MKLLLHVCCAPCLIYPLKELSSKGFKVSGFFYNPNIYPLSEYQNRVKAVSDFSATCAIEIIYPEYSPDEFEDAIRLDKNKPGRCIACWGERLRKTADIARSQGFDYFSTTLLVSPYQDQERVKEIGDKASGAFGVPFYYEDFRPGFRQAHSQAKAAGLYCQKYCGCSLSKEEACRK